MVGRFSVVFCVVFVRYWLVLVGLVLVKVVWLICNGVLVGYNGGRFRIVLVYRV